MRLHLFPSQLSSLRHTNDTSGVDMIPNTVHIHGGLRLVGAWEREPKLTGKTRSCCRGTTEASSPPNFSLSSAFCGVECTSCDGSVGSDRGYSEQGRHTFSSSCCCAAGGAAISSPLMHHILIVFLLLWLVTSLYIRDDTHYRSSSQTPQTTIFYL